MCWETGPCTACIPTCDGRPSALSRRTCKLGERRAAEVSSPAQLHARSACRVAYKASRRRQADVHLSRRIVSQQPCPTELLKDRCCHSQLYIDLLSRRLPAGRLGLVLQVRLRTGPFGRTASSPTLGGLPTPTLVRCRTWAVHTSPSARQGRCGGTACVSSGRGQSTGRPSTVADVTTRCPQKSPGARTSHCRNMPIATG
jgi:hypothetical protein